MDCSEIEKLKKAVINFEKEKEERLRNIRQFTSCSKFSRLANKQEELEVQAIKQLDDRIHRLKEEIRLYTQKNELQGPKKRKRIHLHREDKEKETGLGTSKKSFIEILSSDSEPNESEDSDYSTNQDSREEEKADSDLRDNVEIDDSNVQFSEESEKGDSDNETGSIEEYNEENQGECETSSFDSFADDSADINNNRDDSTYSQNESVRNNNQEPNGDSINNVEGGTNNHENNLDEEHDYDLELDEDEERVRTKIRSSNLMMTIQGFQSKSRQYAEIRSEDYDVEQLESNTNKKSYDPEFVLHKGQRYVKGRCYNMEVDIEGDRDYSTIGILRFLPQRGRVTLARCVLIVPFEDTILGMEDEGVSFTADFKPSSYVRVHQCIEDVPIPQLESESTDVETIPEIIYDPQKPGNCQQFGYFFDKSKIKRRGKRRGLRVLEIFIGAGGMHQGYRNAGFKIVKGVDNDKSAIRTLQANFNDTPVYLGDVKDFLSFLQTPGGRELLGRVDHVHLSPPCQGFSGANRNGGANDEINNALSMLIIDFVRITKCTTAVFENVLGMWRRKHMHYVKNICKELLKLGYQVRCASLKACDYGDAQKRPRFFIFASHKSAPPPIIPPKTHGEGPDLLPFVIVKDVLGNIQHGDEGMMNMNGRTTSLQPGQHGVVRLDPNGLAPAIRASSIPPLHYDEDRCIYVREAASLQSFPIDYVFYGDMRSQYRQVGNAVPVELATAVAQSVRQILIYEYEEED